MYDRPDPVEQLAAVAGYLREQVLPRLDGQAAYHARVCANMLDIVGRQWQQAPVAEADELARLRDLLGMDGSLQALNRELCDRIADGRIDAAAPGLAAHLWRVTLDKLAVDQPRYDGFLRATLPDGPA